MFSNKLILNTIVVVSILFICAPMVQSYRILVFNPDEQMNRYAWDHKRSESYEQNMISSTNKSPVDPSCLSEPCNPDDLAPRPLPDMSADEKQKSSINNRHKKFGASKIFYWPMFEEQM
ncbi:uncharacterized protein LOC118276930 isoform X2 [Spodoptera frugiperda]|uniref:Uncharacterized protein LOC118276930 isoform X2 n=1 Tax=Spodoptera frugiperda TaxID=7108 RepID=A0A9R0DZ80_SPOFR|nr:uncharacterized protein LOC118276930 isoform X2 [Spodoptera frugiperda]